MSSTSYILKEILSEERKTEMIDISQREALWCHCLKSASAEDVGWLQVIE